MSNTASGPGVQSVERAVIALEILARHGAVGVSQIAADIGVHKSTAFRLLSALEGRGLVEQTRDRGKYQLGLGILRLAATVPGRLDLVVQGRAVCEQLAVEFGETVNLAVLRSHHAVNVDQSRGPAAVAAHNWVGELTPLHATSSGKVLLAHQPDPVRKALLDAAGLERFTKRTITRRRELAAVLSAVLADGFATTVEEYEDGLNAIAAPVRDHTGAVVAAVSVSGPAYRLDERQLAKIASGVIAGGERISERIGHFAAR